MGKRVHVVQRTRDQKKPKQLAKDFSKTVMGFSWFQPTYSFPVTGDAQHPDGECIIDTSNGDHVDVVIELSIAIVRLC